MRRRVAGRIPAFARAGPLSKFKQPAIIADQLLDWWEQYDRAIAPALNLKVAMPRILMSAALLLTGISVAQAQTDRTVYTAGQNIRAEFSLSERTSEGGRLTPFFTSYRPNVSFENGASVVCRFVVNSEGGHKPGTTGEIGMTCPVPVNEGQRFKAYERKRLVGSGVVLPPRR